MRVWLVLLSLPVLIVALDKCSAGLESETAENVNTLIDGAISTISGVPGVGVAVGAFIPIVKRMIRLAACEKKEMDFIKNEFQQIRTALFEYTGRLEVAVKLDIVREIESNSRVLMHYLENIAVDPHSTSKSIAEFLQKCDELKPYDAIVKMKHQFEEVLPVALKNDPLHSTKNLNEMKRMLNSILVELTFVTLFQHNLNATLIAEDRQTKINNLDRLLQDTVKATNKIFEKLLDFDYWVNMDHIVTKVLSTSKSSDNKDKMELIGKHLQEIHTTDRFCVVAHSSGDKNHKKYLYASDKENKLYYENENQNVHIIRSRTAYKSTADEFNANMRYNVGGYQIEDSVSSWDDAARNKKTLEHLKKYSISAILVDAKLEGSSEFKCFGVPTYETTQTWTLSNSLYFETIKKLIVMPN